MKGYLIGEKDSTCNRLTIYEKRAFLSRIAFLFLFLFTISWVAAQQTDIITEQVYGSDPLLYNGKYYTFFPPLNTGGSQFFDDRQFEVGSATIRGVDYTNLLLNYDIYNQQLILKYINNTCTTTLIAVSDAWLEKFSVKGTHFEMILIQDTLKRIFQVLGTGPDHILYYWKKYLELDSFFGAKNHEFSAARKEMSLFTGNKFLMFRNNKSFYSLFIPEKKGAIKEYLRNNNINVKKANDYKMTGLINYCNSINGK